MAIALTLAFGLAAFSQAALVDDFNRADGDPGVTSVGAIPWISQDSFGSAQGGLVTIENNQLLVGNGTPYTLDENDVPDPDTNSTGTQNMFAQLGGTGLGGNFGNNIRLTVDIDFGVITGPDSAINSEEPNIGYNLWHNEAQIHIRRPDGASYTGADPGIVMVGIYPTGGIRFRGSDNSNTWTNILQYRVDGSSTSNPHFTTRTTSPFGGSLQATIEVLDDELRVAINGNHVATYFIDPNVPTLGESYIALGKIIRTSAGDGARFNVRYDNLDIEAITSLASPGDYNDDGVVNAADYVAWRDQLGGSTLLNETESLGIVDQDDYDVWLANFGAGGGGGSSSASAMVPEPASYLLLILSAFLACSLCKRLG